MGLAAPVVVGVDRWKEAIAWSSTQTSHFTTDPSGAQIGTLMWRRAGERPLVEAATSCRFLSADHPVPSIYSIRRRNPDILDSPAIGLAGYAEGRPVDDETRRS